MFGWPFRSLDEPRSPDTDFWYQMFDHHSLQKISELVWEREKMYFSLAAFHPTSQERITGICDTHIRGIHTPFANIKNARERFLSARDYIARTGRMPKPVILMEDWHGLRILDGNHRLAAMASFSNADKGIVDCWIGILYL